MTDLFPFGANVMAKKTATKKLAAGESIADKARAYHKANPGKTTQEIADHLGTSYNNVYQSLKKKGGKKAGKKKAKAGGVPNKNWAGNGSATVGLAAIQLGRDFIAASGGAENAAHLLKVLS